MCDLNASSWQRSRLLSTRPKAHTSAGARFPAEAVNAFGVMAVDAIRLSCGLTCIWARSAKAGVIVLVLYEG
ncbi:hypothetical protein PSEUDO9AG_40374 [Pseudomonas sp. 9Ag]|nr:hypothetical protein PSEUDO9AG_40374 [Pseudomonas sp. 9Ag]